MYTGSSPKLGWKRGNRNKYVAYMNFWRVAVPSLTTSHFHAPPLTKGSAIVGSKSGGSGRLRVCKLFADERIILTASGEVPEQHVI